MKRSINNKKIIIIICVCILGISLIGGTVAFYVRELFNTGDQDSITYGLDYYINYAKGQNIENVTLEPSSSYVGSPASSDIEFWKKDNTYDIYGHLYMDINSLSDTLSDAGALKYSVVYHGNIISEGSIVNNEEGTILMAANIPLETSERLFTVYVWLDENLVPGSSINSQSLSLSVRCEATMQAIDYVNKGGTTLITDFEYYLGSENPIVSLSFTDAWYNSMDEYEEFSVTLLDMELAENEVLLTKYIGVSSDVNVPDTYVIDGDIYNVVLYSFTTAFVGDGGDEQYNGGTFLGNNRIKNVVLDENVKVMLNLSNMEFGAIGYEYGYSDDPETAVYENDAALLFYGCTSLVNANLPRNITSVALTFVGCTSLVNVPEIPSSVTNMISTFRGCTSLVNAPEIPASVTRMDSTFFGCTSLVNAPEIPASVTRMDSTFSGCTSLVNAPEIPASVTSMDSTFFGCTSLTGTVKINTTSLSNVNKWSSGTIYNVFSGTSKPITVSVPNGSTTYNTFNNNLGTTSVPSNVRLVTH